jgi:cysteine sulfinate desulfinase/cysteine desulfurase-like protein
VRKKHPTVTRLAGVSAKLERNSFRISFSKESKRKDIDALIDALKQMRDDGHNGR